MSLLTRGLEEGDVLVTSGGVSMGEKVQAYYRPQSKAAAPLPASLPFQLGFCARPKARLGVTHSLQSHVLSLAILQLTKAVRGGDLGGN